MSTFSYKVHGEANGLEFQKALQWTRKEYDYICGPGNLILRSYRADPAQLAKVSLLSHSEIGTVPSSNNSNKWRMKFNFVFQKTARRICRKDLKSCRQFIYFCTLLVQDGPWAPPHHTLDWRCYAPSSAPADACRLADRAVTMQCTTTRTATAEASPRHAALLLAHQLGLDDHLLLDCDKPWLLSSA